MGDNRPPLPSPAGRRTAHRFAGPSRRGSPFRTPVKFPPPVSVPGDVTPPVQQPYRSRNTIRRRREIRTVPAICSGLRRRMLPFHFTTMVAHLPKAKTTL